jgi:hypothetical protein
MPAAQGRLKSAPGATVRLMCRRQSKTGRSVLGLATDALTFDVGRSNDRAAHVSRSKQSHTAADS